MAIKSDIKLKYTGGSSSGAFVSGGVPVYTDLALKYHTTASYRDIYDNHTHHIYNLNPSAWTIKYSIIDGRRDITVSTTAIPHGSRHQAFEIDDDTREYYITISAYKTTGSITTNTSVVTDIDTVQYIKRDREDFDIQDLYGNNQLLLKGLNPKRSQNIITEGLAYNLDSYIDTNFSLRPYTPSYIYDEPGWKELVEYFEEVLGSRYNIIKQLNQFNTAYDDINLGTARKYGVPLDWIKSNYISNNILKNKEQIKNLYYLWSKKGNLTALYGALKFFCDVHPYESFKEEDLGWFLTDLSGGGSYGVSDIDITTFSPDDSLSALSVDEYFDDVVFGADATETYYATDFRLAIKLNYYIDAWGVKQTFGQYDSVSSGSEPLTGANYGPELLDSIFRITDGFTPFNAKVYYYWLHVHTNERVNMYTTYT